MRKYLIITIVTFIFVTVAYSQKIIETESVAKVSISQKTGDNSYTADYILTTKFDQNTLEFKTRDNQPFERLTTKKITEKYVIGEASGNYAFFNIEKEQLFLIEFFMGRYMVNGYGKDYSSLKETSMQLMKMLKEGKTQKDAMAHLVKQADYDF